MAAKRGSQYLGLVCAATVTACAMAPIGPSVPPPSLRQEMEEGSAAWFLNAVSSLTLSFEQQQLIISVRQEVSSRSELVNIARRRLVGLVADGIASGTFDNARLGAALEEILAAAKERAPAVVDALTRLHAALTPAQHKSVVETINEALSIQASQAGGEREELQQRVTSLTAQVGLTAAQSAQLKSDILDGFRSYALDLREEADLRRRKLGGLAQAFAGVYFAPTVADVSAASDLEAKAQRLIAFARKLSGILTAEQRARVAAALRERASWD
jgi:Spy/CpxP family protein refolding chaperone